MYRSEKILFAGTCDNGYLTKMMAPSKVDEQIKEIFGDFFDKRKPPGWFEDGSDYEEEEPHSQKTSPGPPSQEANMMPKRLTNVMCKPGHSTRISTRDIQRRRTLQAGKASLQM